MRKGTLVYTYQLPDYDGNESFPTEKISNLIPVDGDFLPYNQNSYILLKPIETIKLGEFVIGYDGQPHRVEMVSECQYHGDMLMLRHVDSEDRIYLLENQRVLSQRRVQQLTPNGKWSGIPSSHFGRARELRKEATYPEQKLWDYLSRGQLGVKFRRQHPIGPFIADFYARKCGLVVEVDGEMNHSNPDQIEYDQMRDDFMNRLGLRVLRFSARDVMKRSKKVVADIKNHALEYVLDEDQTKQWRFAKYLQSGDFIYREFPHQVCNIATVERIPVNEKLIYLQIPEDHSYTTSTAIVTPPNINKPLMPFA